MKAILRRIRGALGNAIVWGTSWFGLALTILGSFHLAGVFPGPWRLILAMSANFGTVGFITGAVFSAALPILYKNRSVLELRVGRFALSASAIAAVVVPVVTILAQASIGNAVPLGDVVAFGVWAALLGGASAAGTLIVAQRDARRLLSSADAQLTAEEDRVNALLAKAKGT